MGIASVQPLITWLRLGFGFGFGFGRWWCGRRRERLATSWMGDTWLGAKVVGSPRSYEESNFSPSG